MKTVVFCVCIMAILLCGCKNDTSDTSSLPPYTGYASKYLEYANAKSADFILADETLSLGVGQSIGGFTLTQLLSQPDEFGGVRASFSCNVTVSGTFSYMKNDVYGMLLRFFPDDPAVFPSLVGESDGDGWLVVQEGNDPLSMLGFSEGTAAEKKCSVKITSFSVNCSPQHTTDYIKIGEITE